MADGQTYFFDLAAGLKPEDVVMLPWAKELQQKRIDNDHGDDPLSRCLPHGVPRVNTNGLFPFKIVQTPGLVVILYEQLSLFRQVFLDGREVNFKTPQDARSAGIETVYQTLAVAPALDIAANMFLGRERRRSGPLGSVLRMLDMKGMKEDAGKSMANLGIAKVQNMSQAVETLSGGQRQAVAVARAATFATKFVVLDEPTAALGVKETGQVLNLIQQIKAKGLPVILISHNMPNVFEVSDRIHIARLGCCAGIITPKSHTPTEAVAIMTGATTLQKG